MPIYEYTCKQCNTKFEKLLRTMNPDQRPPCPSCGSNKTHRDLSVFAVSKSAPKSAPSPCNRCGNGPCPMAG